MLKILFREVIRLLKPLPTRSRSWYNVPEREGDIMSEVGAEINLDFMYKFCPKCKYAMSECVAIPEVRWRLAEILRQEHAIDERVFARVLKEVYEEKYSRKKDNPNFCYASARKILRELEALFDSEVS